MGSTVSKSTRKFPKTLNPSSLNRPDDFIAVKPKSRELDTGVQKVQKVQSSDQIDDLKGSVSEGNKDESKVAEKGPGDSVGDGQDPQFADRLKHLGQVQFKQVNQPYLKENPLLQAINNRQDVTLKSLRNMEDESIKKKYTHPQTISAILQAQENGESKAQILEDYNLDPDFFSRLGDKYSIPKRPVVKSPAATPKALDLDESESASQGVQEKAQEGAQEGAQKGGLDTNRIVNKVN